MSEQTEVSHNSPEYDAWLKTNAEELAAAGSLIRKSVEEINAANRIIDRAIKSLKGLD